MADIFLSYPWKNKKQVIPIFQALKDLHWKVFMDEEEPGAGSLTEHIIRNLQEAQCMIVIVSKAKKDSCWMAKEIIEFEKIEHKDRHRAGKARILPVHIQNNMRDDSHVNFDINIYTALNFVKWNGNLASKPWTDLVNIISQWVKPGTLFTNILSSKAIPDAVSTPEHETEENKRKTRQIGDLSKRKQCKNNHNTLTTLREELIATRTEIEALDRQLADCCQLKTQWDDLCIEIIEKEQRLGRLLDADNYIDENTFTRWKLEVNNLKDRRDMIQNHLLQCNETHIRNTKYHKEKRISELESILDILSKS